MVAGEWKHDSHLFELLVTGELDCTVRNNTDDIGAVSSHEPEEPFLHPHLA